MELFAFFVGGGQTHHREIFFLGRHKKLLQPEKRGIFTYEKTKSKIILSAQAFYEVERIFFFLNHRGEEEAHVWYFFLSSKSLLAG